jgi:hypothetical protein
MEKKPSSIEWLVDQFKEYDFSEDDGMYLIKIPSWLLAEKEEKAKAMHKEEIKDAISVGYNMATPSEPYDNLHKGDKYYIEAYGGDDE